MYRGEPVFATLICGFLLVPLLSCGVDATSWTWKAGSSIGDINGTYNGAGNSGVPGARYLPGYWVDKSDQLWLYGGLGCGTVNCYPGNIANKGVDGELSDMWKFSPMTNTWTFVQGGAGTQGAAPVYTGTAQNPGGRHAAATWTDNSGTTLWLYGGISQAPLTPATYADMWSFSTNTNTWTYVSGPQTPNQVMTSSPANPSSKYDASTWVDASDNLWLFGGYGYASQSAGPMNDLWKFSTSSKTWTFVTGPTTIADPGAFNTGNTGTPPARQGAASFVDPNGKFWLFGGLNTNAYMSDLWTINPTAGSPSWTWVTDPVANNPGTYTTGGTPGGRYSPAFWTDISHNFWLFGGYGYDTGTSTSQLGDLWSFSPTATAWTYQGGFTTVDNDGQYPRIIGTPETGMPGCRYGPASWTDSVGQLWLFGGDGFTTPATSATAIADMWVYNAAPLATTTSVSSSSVTASTSATSTAAVSSTVASTSSSSVSVSTSSTKAASTSSVATSSAASTSSASASSASTSGVTSTSAASTLSASTSSASTTVAVTSSASTSGVSTVGATTSSASTASVSTSGVATTTSVQASTSSTSATTLATLSASISGLSGVSLSTASTTAAVTTSTSATALVTISHVASSTTAGTTTSVAATTASSASSTKTTTTSTALAVSTSTDAASTSVASVTSTTAGTTTEAALSTSTSSVSATTTAAASLSSTSTAKATTTAATKATSSSVSTSAKASSTSSSTSAVSTSTSTKTSTTTVKLNGSFRVAPDFLLLSCAAVSSLFIALML